MDRPGFHRGVNEIFALLRRYAAQTSSLDVAGQPISAIFKGQARSSILPYFKALTPVLLKIPVFRGVRPRQLV
jgi:hypothetical protein